MTTETLAAQFVRVVHAAYMNPAVHPAWGQAAADVYVRTRSIQRLLRAAEAMDRLSDLHTERRWSDNSDVTVCAECQQSFPCRTVQAMQAQAVDA